MQAFAVLLFCFQAQSNSRVFRPTFEIVQQNFTVHAIAVDLAFLYIDLALKFKALMELLVAWCLVEVFFYRIKLNSSLFLHAHKK